MKRCYVGWVLRGGFQLACVATVTTRRNEEEGVLAHAQNITQQSSDSIFVFKVDNRVRTLLENGLKLKQRTFLIIVGDHG